MALQSASAGYAIAAQTYTRGKLGYPSEAKNWLQNMLGLCPGKVVLEVGAGTGQFLPLLLETRAADTALEPVEARQAEIIRQFSVNLIGGSTEHIDLPEVTVYALVCAQAFHWFATPEAVAEMGRVLKPGGVLGLIWNMRDTSVPWVAAMQTIIDAHQGDTPRHQTGKWRNVFPAKGFKSLGEQHARNVHIGNPEHVIIDRAMSTSFIAALPAKKRAEVEQSLRTLISETPELAGHNEVGVPYDTLMVAFLRC